MQLEIRRYRDEDHDAVWNLHHIALAEARAHAGTGPWDDDLHNIRAIYLDNGGEFLVGLVDGQILAMGALKRTAETAAEIKRMRVLPGYQGRGFGQQILEALSGRARELGYTRLHLDTSVGQVAAQKLYTRNGFKEVRRGLMLGFECIYYEKYLEEQA